MKSSVLFILALLLASAILVPSAITLLTIDAKTAIVIDYNEEEKQEDKNETSKNDFLFLASRNIVAIQGKAKNKISSPYIISEYPNILAILLPPPKHYH